jgi:DNA-binding beta-propeller fold protein YncE
MKTLKLTFIFSSILYLSLTAQVIKPVFTLNDEPGSTHNAHITSDGKFYYTCNGGTGKDGSPNGKINKYTLTGNFVKSYSFKKFDMRSIMFNSKDKHLYIATFDLKIFKIIDLENGTTELLFEKIYKNPQSAIALDPDGKIFYSMDCGTLTMYKFKDGSVIKTLSGLSFGADDTKKPIIGRYGSTAVAVDKNYIYTWDSHSTSKKIYAYDKKGNFVKDFQISSGNWGFTLSYANGFIFVAVDGQYKIGLWNGYNLWGKK